jgi:hypothetical protein
MFATRVTYPPMSPFARSAPCSSNISHMLITIVIELVPSVNARTCARAQAGSAIAVQHRRAAPSSNTIVGCAYVLWAIAIGEAGRDRQAG